MSSTESTTIEVTVAVDHTDSTGSYSEGDTRTMPFETDADKAEVAGMVAYGIFTTESPKAKARSGR